MSQISIENAIHETTSFKDLRGVQWRIDLGILPSCPSTSIDDLRRVTANSRRRYAALRRRLLVDPHVPENGSSPDLLMDNPLSQNPDSIWGRFFRNAELEKMVDQDLTRLYPERGSYFQTSGCQGMLRRILLLWCLRHPEYGYRQGMHELLAPLLYVLHVDMERLAEVRKLHDDHFADKFDGFSFHENDLTFKFDFKKFDEDVNGFEKCFGKATNLSDLDPEIQTIVLLSDAYGTEGELGVVLSEKFMEHDVYSMFDALMSGAGGVIAMAEFFSHHSTNSQTGFPPVIEASSSIYHLLSIVDSSLHSHLVELGVEPQYFALRWLRVLFGREFSLENLLVIWDEIFAHENKKVERETEDDVESSFGILECPRGVFISSFAVSMILNLRSSLLATETATSCLQRLLNFPDDINLVKLIEKAKSLQDLAAEAKKSNSLPPINGGKKHVNRGHSLSLDFSNTPKSPPGIIPDSYWEEKWRVLHKEEQKQGVLDGNPSKQRKGWSERVKLRLSRTGSVPTPLKKDEQIPKPSVRRNLLKDLARQLESDEVKDKLECDAVCDKGKGSEENANDKIASEDVSSNSSNPPSPVHVYSDHDNESESSVASNSLIGENESSVYSSPLPILPDDALSSKCSAIVDMKDKSGTDVKERKVLSGRFQWLWKLGRNVNNEGTSERRVVSEDEIVGKGNGKNDVSWEDRSESLSGTSKGETVNQNLIVSLRNLGQSMLENIQVIESVFQQEQRVQTALSSDNYLKSHNNTNTNSNNGIVVGKRQVTAMSALKELRKISNLLSEM